MCEPHWKYGGQFESVRRSGAVIQARGPRGQSCLELANQEHRPLSSLSNKRTMLSKPGAAPPMPPVSDTTEGGVSSNASRLNHNFMMGTHFHLPWILAPFLIFRHQESGAPHSRRGLLSCALRRSSSKFLILDPCIRTWSSQRRPLVCSVVVGSLLQGISFQLFIGRDGLKRCHCLPLT
jgi:hypothetical protein